MSWRIRKNTYRKKDQKSTVLLKSRTFFKLSNATENPRKRRKNNPGRVRP